MSKLLCSIKKTTFKNKLIRTVFSFFIILITILPSKSVFMFFSGGGGLSHEYIFNNIAVILIICNKIEIDI